MVAKVMALEEQVEEEETLEALVGVMGALISVALGAAEARLREVRAEPEEEDLLLQELRVFLVIRVS